jgi:hypothetical protein
MRNRRSAWAALGGLVGCFLDKLQAPFDTGFSDSKYGTVRNTFKVQSLCRTSFTQKSETHYFRVPSVDNELHTASY